MPKYEMLSNYQEWRPATPKPALEKLLEDNPGRTITIQEKDGSMSKWRQASRDPDVLSTIKNVLYDCDTTSSIHILATSNKIYDALLDMGYLK